ncbi:uncharacterized protein LOC123879939 isoform X2 [Maniola jurtina]|uniref:uncharacterized protein LOC123879939 isoform X2 n=1 Tax=Maniola jurtina TaxID=191418 RepID=UPI001E68F43B|nr:uncharacterized protein LOC123879939 isoform X2 [Maniola jurtina]
MSLKELMIKRSSVKGRVTKFKNYISKVNKLSVLDSLELGHFLIGRPPTTLPSPNIEDFSSSSLDRYSKLELVLLQEDNGAPLNWRLDWVTALYPELMEFPVSPISEPREEWCAGL